MRNGELFYREFVKAVSAYGITLDEYQQGGSAFTERMIGLIEAILKKNFGFRAEREYFRIDVIGWKEKYQEVADKAKACRMNPHLWDLEIAVEHENNPRDWTDELVKLAHIKCPLRVVIGYNPCDERERGEGGRLELAASLLNRTRAFSGSDGAFLLIFGNSAAVDPLVSYQAFDYRGYLYDAETEGFTEIKI